MADCEDVYTVLAAQLGKHLGYAECWYWGAKTPYKQKTGKHFVERRLVGNFTAAHAKKRKWDFIIARGGFKEYDPILQNARGAKLVYYGAGVRFYPQPNMHRKYDLILVDTKKQLKEVRSMLVTGKIKGKPVIFPKPAAPLFRPVEIKKKYDICFPANATYKFKGHAQLFKELQGTKLTVLCIGLRDSSTESMAKSYGIKATFHPWVRRAKLPKLYSQCKVGVVMTLGTRDSCPRVVPEMLACDLPIVAADYVNISGEHINDRTGYFAAKGCVAAAVDIVIKERKRLDPRAYYNEQLKMGVVSAQLTGELLKL